MTNPQDESVPAAPVKPIAPPVVPVPVVQEPVEPRRKFWQALFFTKDGRLDITQLLMGICCVVGLTVFVGQASGKIPVGRPDPEAWGWFAAFTAFAFGAGAVTNNASLKNKASAVVQTVTRVIGDRRAPAVPPNNSAEPNLFTDDESGD